MSATRQRQPLGSSGRQLRWKVYEIWRHFDRWFSRDLVRRRFFLFMSLLSAIGLFGYVIYTLEFLSQASPLQEFDDLQHQIRRKNIQARIKERLDARHNGYEKRCSSAESLENVDFPECAEKVEWMKQFWKSDPCYAENDVNGTDCSFLRFLSEVQHFCPPLHWRNVTKGEGVRVFKNQTEVTGLFELMTDSPFNFDWIKNRISRMWPTWLDALKFLEKEDPKALVNRRLTILLHLGFLSRETGLNFGKKSAQGGPLGELVQWSDLIASTYLLGHKVLISTEFATFKSNVLDSTSKLNACNAQGDSGIDLIFTDIMGLRMMRRKLKKQYPYLSCRLRILDSFGTHAEFNSNEYFKKHRSELGGKPTNVWGGHQLKLGQFLTMYPHTDDNTFLGFVVEVYNRATSAPVERENVSLVYGKEAYMWNGADSALNILKDFTPIHATIADDDEVLKKKWNIVNHKLLSGPDFHDQLKRSKIFFGLGFPLEGPAPLEAVANGAVFINPKFTPPKSRRSYKFFADKPTLRELTSQNPYVERFIGEPHVYTVHFANETALRAVITSALNSSVEPFLPFEFTAAGMLQRVHIITSHHNFCTEKPIWPPFSSGRIIHAEAGLSCQEACAQQELLCERTFFWRINKATELAKVAPCDGAVKESTATYAPTSCLLQQNPLLFSCASKPPTLVRRICPCRTFRRGQSIMCGDSV